MKKQLLFSFTLIALISVVSVVLVFRSQTNIEVRDFVVRSSAMGTQNLVSLLQEYYRQANSWNGVEQIFESPIRVRSQGMGALMGRNTSWMHWRLADATGSIVHDTNQRASKAKINAAERKAAIPIDVDGQTVGYLIAEISLDFEQRSMRPFMERINRAAIIAALIAVSLSLVIALGLSYGLLRPVRALTKAAGNLAQGDLSQRVPVQGTDELANLSQTFNQMAESLQRAEESRRAMTADIAHELRTPLAVQRAQLEALLDGVYDLNAENLQAIVAQNTLLTRLVEDLRTVTLADSGDLHLERIPTDLCTLVTRSIEQFTPQAKARSIEIQSTLTSDCPRLDLDPGRIEQILGNLFSNALRHTPQEGIIHVQLFCTSQQINVSIHDSGTGIPEEALPHIFDRLYRADKARSRQAGGSGLGLTIARKLARAHNGDLTAANHPQGGAIFTLTLPLS